MTCIIDCAFCKHRRNSKKDGWIPTCDAFPDGRPLDFSYAGLKERKDCGNGIGFEPKEDKPSE